MATPEQARLRRLQRLARLRAIDRDAALRDVAQTETTLAQLVRLAERTEALAAIYAGQRGPGDGADLAAAMRYQSGLGTIAGTARAETGDARTAADRQQQLLAQAERRRAATAERADMARRALFAQKPGQPSGARRAIGTALEE